MSHVKQQVTIQQVYRAKVIALLGITDLQYHEFVMQQGYAYLHQQLGDNHLGAKLAENALYWAWWRNHWHDTDVEFTESVKYMNRAEMQQYYELLHETKSFEYKPQRAILADAVQKIKNPIIKHQL